MEQWEIEFEWLKLRHFIKDKFDKEVIPDMKAVLFLVGVQESGIIKEEYTKEEKQDLMHVAVCELLAPDGFYEFQGRDHDGWPHYKKTKPIYQMKVEDQEGLLTTKLIQYFKERNDIN